MFRVERQNAEYREQLLRTIRERDGSDELLKQNKDIMNARVQEVGRLN
jgi:hypothetical protein